jgi:hypothetical protein
VEPLTRGLGGVLSSLSSTEFVEPPTAEQNSCVRHCLPQPEQQPHTQQKGESVKIMDLKLSPGGGSSTVSSRSLGCSNYVREYLIFCWRLFNFKPVEWTPFEYSVKTTELGKGYIFFYVFMLQASEYSLNLFFLKQKYISNEPEINKSLKKSLYLCFM